MNAKGKLRIIFSGSEADGNFSEENRVVLADALMHVIEQSHFSILELHIVLPAEDVQQILDGIERAGVDLMIEDMAAVRELN